MKKDYIKPCVIIDSLELLSFVLSGNDLSYGGEVGGGDSHDADARERYLDSSSSGWRGQQGSSSNGASRKGWGSLW